MPPSPSQLKDKLLSAIDDDNNILNQDVLLEVIAFLEKTAITKEDLEATRLGWYINNVRRKTPGDIGKRLRKLVKAWQSLATPIPSNNSSPNLGYSPAVNARINSPALSSSPRVHSRNNNASPALQDKPRLSSPATNDAGIPGKRLVSPLVRQAGGRDSPLPANIRRISPSNFKPSTPRSTASSTPVASSKVTTSRPCTPNGAKYLNDNVGNHTPVPTPTANHLNTTHNFDGTNRTHAANKKRRRSDESNNSDGVSVKKNRTMVNGETSRLAERIKTPKVKTTVEIIAELQAGKGTPLSASDTINQIVRNQIEKEEDDIHAPVVPASALPRNRRKNGAAVPPDPSSTRSELSKTKSDLVHRFLQQSFEHGSSRNDEFQVRPEFQPNTEPGDVDVTGLTPAGTSTIDMSVDPYSLLPPIDYNSISWSDDDYEDQPVRKNAITGEYPEGYEPSNSSSSSNSPAQSHVEKVICEDWNGVNGTTNVNNQFHPWTETFTINPSAEQNDNVHVLLPYVDL